MTDFGWHLPPGVTDAMIDARYADADTEKAIDVADRWLSSDPGWWRRYVAADDRSRRRALYDARVDADPVDVAWAFDLADWLEDERRYVIQAASQRARHGVTRARRALAVA